MSAASNNPEESETCGWVFYDGECPFCVASACQLEKQFGKRGIRIAPRQTPWVRERLQFETDEPPKEMLLLTPDGRLLGGADALLYMARIVWWTWPVYAFSRLPGVLPILRAGYRWVAKHRHSIPLRRPG